MSSMRVERSMSGTCEPVLRLDGVLNPPPPPLYVIFCGGGGLVCLPFKITFCVLVLGGGGGGGGSQLNQCRKVNERSVTVE